MTVLIIICFLLSGFFNFSDSIAVTVDLTECLSTGKKFFSKGNYEKANTILTDPILKQDTEASFYKLATLNLLNPLNTSDLYSISPCVLEYMEEEAKKGNTLSYLIKGLLKLRPESTDKDKKEGMTLLMKASADNKHAQYLLGLFFLRGDPPFDQDQSTAIKYFRKAIKTGHEDAAEKLLTLGEPISIGCVKTTFLCITQVPMRYIKRFGVATGNFLDHVVDTINSLPPDVVIYNV